MRPTLQIFSIPFHAAHAKAWAVIALIFACFLFFPLAAMADQMGQASSVAAAVSGKTKLSNLTFGLFLGVMITATAYLFFIWMAMHDRGQVFLLFLLLCLSANIAVSNDLLMQQIGLGDETTRSILSTYTLIFSCIFSVVFSYYFLESDIQNQGFVWPIGMLGTVLVSMLIYSVFDPRLVHFVLPGVSALTLALVLIIGIISAYQGISGSVTHVIAFTFFFAGILAEPMYNLGYLELPTTSSNLTYIGFSMAALMFAIVTASQFATRQEEKEKALATSNERFSLATRGANEGLFDWNLETGEVFFSDQFRRIIGYRLDNTAASLKTWLRLMLPADRRIVREALRRFRRSSTNNTITIEYRVVPGPASDEKRWLHTKAVAVRSPITKHITRMVGSTSDISSRKKSEDALRASELRFRSITEAHPVPVLIVGLRNGTIFYASPSTDKLLGVPQRVHGYESFERFLPDHGTRSEIWDVMAHGREINLKEVKLRRDDGTEIDAALSARRISYQNEEAMVVGLYDLTERKKAEAQIAQQQEALQQSEKMAALGGLLAGVAHELNNPLSVVVGQATLLMDGAPEPKVVTRAEKIYKAADRCSRIVKSFLALARRKEPERKPMDLNATIHNALELLGYQMRTGNIDVVLNLEENLPVITGDGDQMTQVMTNIILNAAQALLTWNGEKRVTIGTWHDDHGHVFVRVTDTGPGVPPAIKARIFEPFFTTKSTAGGTGVGLSLCLNIVESHGGELRLEDAPSGGASFTISLPCFVGTVENHTEVGQGVTKLPILRILLVDDEVEIAQTLADLLEPDGHTIDIAANGAIALDKLRNNDFDIIISDLRMPVLDGPGLYDALQRELPSYLNKIIYVTGDTLSTHVQAFLKQHPVPVVDKPYRLKDVQQAVDVLLRNNHQSEAVGQTV